MLNKLIAYLGEENVYENEPMSLHTTFRCGGPARYFCYVNSEEDLIKTIGLAWEEGTPYFILGNGSNLLVSDKGYDGVIIKLAGEFDVLHTSGNSMVAGSGVFLSQIAAKALEDELSGLEFASGIPGTVGGAIVMNAGAYDGEMKDVVKSVRLLFIDGGKCEIETLSCDEMQFSYRHSILKEKKGIVLAVKMELKKGNSQEIKEKMDDFNGRRREKQPLEYPSAGSTFKRPEGHFAGKLISDAGLKGVSIGFAEVSEKHAGFIINKGGARASEVMQLINYVRDKVLEETGITLEPEVIFLGNFE